MFKQPIYQLTLTATLLIGAVVTATGQTTNTMPTQSGTTTNNPQSQTSSQSSSMSGSSTGMSSSSSMSGSSTSTGMTSSSSMNGSSSMQGASTGADLAASAGMSSEHSTLLNALQAAGLTDRAKSAGPYTIFAPTNSAFEKIPSATRTDLMKPANKTKLTGVLTTHVVQGSYKASDLSDGQQLKTVNGETLTVSKQGNTVMVKDGKGGSAKVLTPDIQATNGVVHSIDTVLMPSK